MLDSFFFRKKQEKDGQQRVEPSVQFQNQRGVSFETLKYDMCANPNSVIFTKNA